MNLLYIFLCLFGFIDPPEKVSKEMFDTLHWLAVTAEISDQYLGNNFKNAISYIRCSIYVLHDAPSIKNIEMLPDYDTATKGYNLIRDYTLTYHYQKLSFSNKQKCNKLVRLWTILYSIQVTYTWYDKRVLLKEMREILGPSYYSGYIPGPLPLELFEEVP